MSKIQASNLVLHLETTSCWSRDASKRYLLPCKHGEMQTCFRRRWRTNLSYIRDMFTPSSLPEAMQHAHASGWGRCVMLELMTTDHAIRRTSRYLDMLSLRFRRPPLSAKYALLRKVFHLILIRLRDSYCKLSLCIARKLLGMLRCVFNENIVYGVSFFSRRYIKIHQQSGMCQQLVLSTDLLVRIRSMKCLVHPRLGLI